MRKFFRSPALMMSSMMFPFMQLIVLGYAFGGKIKGVKIALVDKDGGSESRLVREGLNGISEGPATFGVLNDSELPDAMTDLRAGFVKAVVYIPADYFTRRFAQTKARASLSSRTTPTASPPAAFPSGFRHMQNDLNGPARPPRSRANRPTLASRLPPARSACRNRSPYRPSRCIPTSSTSNICWLARFHCRCSWWP